MKAISPRYPTFVIHEGYDRSLALESVGAGWASLIHEVFDFLANHQQKFRIIQVKEKWGGLRIYYVENRYDVAEMETFDNLIRDIENRSLKMCETCGAPGLVRGDSWYYTSCEQHAKNNEPPHAWQPGDKND